jgi:hypothetical protein
MVIDKLEECSRSSKVSKTDTFNPATLDAVEKIEHNGHAVGH